MPDPATNASSPQTVALARVRPLGGSKWAGFYGGAAALKIAEPGTIIQENAVIDPDGRVTRAADVPQSAPAAEQRTVFVLEAGEKISLGQFLTGTLNVALQAPDAPPLCGPVLTPRQTDVLAKLGRLRDYTPITAPQAFTKVICAMFSPGAVPGPAVRLVADKLRLPAPTPGAAIAILPVRQFERFGLINRASLTAWLRAKRFTVVEPERLKLAELSALLAAAPVVLLADPRQAGLLSLCNPGTKILEIAPEGWLNATGHFFCSLFGLSWQAFLAAPPSYPLRGALPFGSLVPCSYEISIRELASALHIFVDS